MTPSPSQVRFFALLFLAAAILFGQIQNEVLYTPDGIAYALVAKEIAERPWWTLAQASWLGAPFFEHPPLTPMLIALVFKFFGVATVGALVIPALLSIGTVAATYGIAATLVSPGAGLLAGTILALTPQFVKEGRNSMLEPALMFFLTLSVFLLLKKRHFFAGLTLGLAVLAKGPPALLGLGVLSFWSAYRKWTTKELLRNGGLSLMGALLVPSVFDLWHLAITSQSFWAHYIGHQLTSVFSGARTGSVGPWYAYLQQVPRYWPWLPFILLSPLAALKRPNLRPLFWVGLCLWAGTLVGFSLMKQKSPWYINIYQSGGALLAACSAAILFKQETTERLFVRFAMGLTLPLLFLSSSFPKVLLGYPRPAEHFLEAARAEGVTKATAGRSIADCIRMDDWKGPFFYRFYLDATRTPCDDSQADFRVIDFRNSTPRGKILFSRHPLLIEQAR